MTTTAPFVAPSHGVYRARSMRGFIAAALVLVASCGCGQPWSDCVTPGGVLVRGTTDCALIARVQLTVELTSASVDGLHTHSLEGQGVHLYRTESGEFVWPDRRKPGYTKHGDIDWAMVAVREADLTFSTDVLVHELFHMFEDEKATIARQKACGVDYACLTLAAHYEWEKEIFPAIKSADAAIGSAVLQLDRATLPVAPQP